MLCVSAPPLEIFQVGLFVLLGRQEVGNFNTSEFVAFVLNERAIVVERVILPTAARASQERLRGQTDGHQHPHIGSEQIEAVRAPEDRGHSGILPSLLPDHEPG